MHKIFLIFLFSLSSCIFVPAIDSYKKLGLSKSDRERILGKDVKDFTEALYWNHKTEAMQKISEDNLVEVEKELEKYNEETKVVDNKVDSIKFDSESRSATVFVKVRYFKVPFYTVVDRKDISKWTFTLSNGWKLHSLIVGQ